MDELVEAVKNLKINDAKYYESNKATASDTQGDPIGSTYIVTHTGNEKKQLLTLVTEEALN